MKERTFNPVSPVSVPFVLRVLGSFQLTHNRQVLSLPTRKIESLLAYLVLHPEAHAREKLAALFWGDMPDTHARQSLRYALAMLRKAIGGNLLIADRETVQFNPQFPIWVDAREFSDEIRGMNEDHLSVLSTPLLDQDFYRGNLLADFYDDWIFAEREQYRSHYVEALLHLVQAFRSASEYDHAIETARRVLTTDTANERAHQHLMFCFIAVGKRDAALQQYQTLARTLRAELAVEPSAESTALYNWIKQAASESPSLAARLTNLPIPLTSFIGRTQEMAEVKGVLRRKEESLTLPPSATYTRFGTRLLTLTGAGGSGKTRFAIQIATDLLDAYHDGVWWVELAAFTDDTYVPPAVAKALGVQESLQQPLLDTLVNFLRDKQLLLVLDNCEHLLDACAQLARPVLAACANVQILATSREPLGFIGETVRVLPTLAFPNPNAIGLTELLMQYEAIRLFIERARGANSQFTLTGQNALAVTQICARLDGIPLALELAAARVYEMSVQEITARLDDRFSFLSRGNRGALPRQQTLSALIAWSYDLLSDQEQVLFRRLAVFAGSFILEAVEQVCAPTQAPIRELISSLVHKSLVTIERDANETRYRLLETIREYAAQELRAAGEEKQQRTNHLEYVVAFAEAIEPQRLGSEHGRWLEQLERVHNDVRVALEWATERDDRMMILRLSGAMGLFWERRGYWSEGRQWLERALTLNKDIESNSNVSVLQKGWYANALEQGGALNWRARNFQVAQANLEKSLALYQELGNLQRCAEVMGYMGGIEYDRGNYLAAKPFYEAALALRREQGDKHGIADSLGCLGLVLTNLGDFAAARQGLETALAFAQEVGDLHDEAFVLNALGELSYVQQDFTHAYIYFEMSLPLRRKIGDLRGAASTLSNLSALESKRGNYPVARHYAEQSLGLYRAIGYTRGLAEALFYFAHLAYKQGHARAATTLFSVIQALLDSINARLDTRHEQDNSQAVALLRTQISPELFTLSWAEGKAMTLEQAIAYALNENPS